MSNNQNKTGAGIPSVAIFLIALILLACACVIFAWKILPGIVATPTPTPGKTAPVTPPSTQGPEKPVVETLTPTLPPGKPASVEISAWFSISQAGQGLIDDQIARFMQENKEIKVQARYFTESELVKAIQNGETPHIASLTYNPLAVFQSQGLLIDQDSGNYQDPQDFLPQAMQSNTFNNGLLYGLPWLANGCTPTYLNLSMFEQSDLELKASYALINFLTLPNQQAQNYREMTWYPTRASVYDQLGLPQCKAEAVIRPDPAVIPTIQEQIRQVAPIILERFKFSLNEVDVTGVIQGTYKAQQKQVVFFYQADGTLEASAAARLDDPTEEELAGGAFVGALVVNDQGDFPAPAGEYAVSCTPSATPGEPSQCTLLPVDGSDGIPLEAVGESVDDTIVAPSVYVVEGSVQICWRVDRRPFCITFRR